MFSARPKKDATRSPAAMVDAFRAQCEQFGLGENWAVLYDDREVFGLKERHVHSLCGDCALLINLCGALKNDDLLRRAKRRAYFDLDPGFTQIWAHEWDMGLSKHNLFFTVGLNVGQPDFPIPLRGIDWQTFMPPVALEFWPARRRHGQRLRRHGHPPRGPLRYAARSSPNRPKATTRKPRGPSRRSQCGLFLSL